MVIGNLGMIFSNRSRTLSILQTLRIPNPAVWWVSGSALTVIALVLVVPFLRNLFKFAPLHPWEFILILVAGLASILISEIVKIKPIREFLDRK
jgi:P-type Ca2+ transporter type 2C